MTQVPAVAGAVVRPAMISVDRLRAFAPHCFAAGVAPPLDAAAAAHGISSARAVRHWLANLHNESGGFTRCSEDLHYTAAELVKVWPDHFDAAEAARCEGDPKAVACRAYDARDGNVEPLDGWTFRGRGWIQITGRANYAAAGLRLGRPYVGQPDLVAAPRDAALTAADFWQHRGCQAALARYGDDLDAAIAVRRLINGGLNGLDNTLEQLRRAAEIWPR